MAAMGSVLEILDINAILLALKTHLSVHFGGRHPAFLGRRKRASVLELSRSQHLGERAFLRTLSRTLIDPSPIYREILSNELAGLMEGYLDAFQRAMPEFKREEIGNRLDFALGAIGHALSDPGRRGAYSDEEFLAPVERVMPQVLAFVLAGFKAPPVLTPNT